MRNTILITPKDLFCQIEEIVTNNPKLLKAHHWHEMANGKEANTPDQIMAEGTSHCLAGWIVRLTQNAPRFERLREDVDTYANEILTLNGREPIPMAIYKEDEETMLKIIRGRAAREREEAFYNTAPFTMN
jgi:hypothetical protein